MKQTPMKRKGFTPASRAQREKVAREGVCRVTGRRDTLDPSHNTPRGLGGCDHRDCIIPLTRSAHQAYELGQLDVLPYLTLGEQSHAVSHLGILGALKRLTGCEWVPNDS